MRFIKGDSLQEAADRFHRRVEEEQLDFGGVEFRKLLGRFVDVCQAIEYAHSRGVLHRDLKPGNIMLGKYGETLVVDWGLAKTRGSDDSNSAAGENFLRPASASGSAPTVAGSAVGTPAFMPPEQAAGDLDKLGAASDVYSPPAH
jgi:serine/threonine protein kinase